MKLIYAIIIVIMFANCKQKEHNNEIPQGEILEIKKEENILKKFTYEDVARYTMASVMGQETKIIKATKNKELYLVSYVRKSDKQKFNYKVKFEGNKILWANIDGRWRNSEFDEKLSFEEKDDFVKIIQTYSDGSEDIQRYKVGE